MSRDRGWIMEEYYMSLVLRFLGGILVIFMSPFAIIAGFPWLTPLGIVAGAYLSISAYREGKRAL